MKLPFDPLFWKDKGKVIAFAIKMAKGSVPMTVLWNGQNYNIIHTENEERLLRGRPVIYRT